MGSFSHTYVEARLILLSLAAGAVFSWFFEQMFLPGPIGALFAGIIFGSVLTPFLPAVFFFTLGLLFHAPAMRRYLPAITLSALPVFLLGTGLTALVLSPFVRDPFNLLLAAVGGGSAAPILVAYTHRKRYAEATNRALFSAAFFSLLSLIFVIVTLASEPYLHLLRVLSFLCILAFFSYIANFVSPRSGESILFVLAAGFLIGGAFDPFLGPAAYFLGGVLASNAIFSAPRPLRKSILGGLTLMIFLALGAHAGVFTLTSLLVLLAVLVSRILFYVVVHRFILPATFVLGEDNIMLSLDLLASGAPFLYALQTFASPEIYTGALIAVAVSHSVAYLSEISHRAPTKFESVHVASIRGDAKQALALLTSLAIVYAVIPLSYEIYWLPFVLLVPFYIFVHALRRLVHSITGSISEDLSDAYVFAYALLLISLAAFSLIALSPTPLHLLAAFVFALFALYYLRHTAALFFPRKTLYK